ncbi:MAG TPA: SpoIIE family protein phosphatase [Actinomycetota bacterium]|nr:SpoIIE family protein phosphatase [Actinomycetota bacterium]
MSFPAALLLGGAVQVAVAIAFTGASESAYRGVPSGLGLLFSVVAGVLAGPLAGILVALEGGAGFVIFVTNGELGGWVAVVLWIVAAGVAGAIADRYRETGRERDIAHASERRARQAAESESARLAHLHNLTGRLADAVTVRDVCGALVDTAIGSLGADASGVALLSPDGTELERVAARGFPDDVLEAWSRFPADSPVIARDVIREHSVVTLGSAEEALERYPVLASFGEGYPMGALAAAPLLAGDELLGVLGVNFRAPRRFTLEDESLLLAIGRQCGQAIERARLFEAEQRALRRAARLQEVTARLARAVTTEDAARAILRGATGSVGADAASIALASDDGRSLRVSPGVLSNGTLRLRPPFEISMNDRAVLAHVYRDGRALWIASPDEWEARFAEGFGTQGDLGRCLYAVPIVAKGEAIGALAVYFREERGKPSAEEAELISSFAHQAGVALERARAYEVEHEAAMTLQRNLMPEGTGYSATVDVDGRYLPATRGVHVGGDWYDIVDRPDGTVAFAVGDIAGHGLQAAAAMGQVRSAWRALALSMTEPNAILASLDRFAGGVDGAFFSTILTLLLDPSRNALRYASAGHPPALVIEPDGSTRFLEGGRSVPLGLPFDLPRPQAQERLGPGSILVVYTDGLIERREEPLDRGLERLAEVASRVRAGSLAEISDELLELVADDRHDDVALLTIGPRHQLEVFRRTFPADPHELATMRADLRTWLERSGLPTETREDVVLACTEAATNAIEHAYIGRHGDVLIEAESKDGMLQVSVTDHGRWRHPRPDDSRGRGLELVRAVIGDVDVERGEGGTTVRMRVGIS